MSARRELPGGLLDRLAADRRRELAGRLIPLARRGRIGGGYVYVIEFYSGMIKVGKSVQPDTRILHHAERAELHGDGVTRFWVSQRHRGFEKTELALIRFCKLHGEPWCGNEYFREVSPEAARDAARAAIDDSANAVEAWTRGAS